MMEEELPFGDKREKAVARCEGPTTPEAPPTNYRWCRLVGLKFHDLL